ncbi:hypothetical protein A3C25_06220 [Candidatus Roizmanbacteria bacterium RIFCSPHIGHO2_02_FULL_38_11]|uniref:Uncharacterized protein n=1 Tax=Candidatus Roizmanbacteria bacterium RIFCSPHIGHO2_02_FULL_38_11 TaxID=1802039 RepID=A0A1F7H1T0_9BACT|nr:MAG: hypothetical protein A3C25_06220 [Candidatus Roizmanbacteria bacterium RIFCSPHIGHO2_02_FULL_38_11]
MDDLNPPATPSTVPDSVRDINLFGPADFASNLAQKLNMESTALADALARYYGEKKIAFGEVASPTTTDLAVISAALFQKAQADKRGEEKVLGYKIGEWTEETRNGGKARELYLSATVGVGGGVTISVTDPGLMHPTMRLSFRKKEESLSRPGVKSKVEYEAQFFGDERKLPDEHKIPGVRRLPGITPAHARMVNPVPLLVSGGTVRYFVDKAFNLSLPPNQPAAPPAS